MVDGGGGQGFDTIRGGAENDRLMGEPEELIAGCEFAIQADALDGGSGDDLFFDFCADNLANGGRGGTPDVLVSCETAIPSRDGIARAAGGRWSAPIHALRVHCHG